MKYTRKRYQNDAGPDNLLFDYARLITTSSKKSLFNRDSRPILGLEEPTSMQLLSSGDHSNDI